MDNDFKLKWLYIDENDLEIEIQQSYDEGLDIVQVEEEINLLKGKLKETKEVLKLQEEIGFLFDRIQKLPLRKDFKFVEPNDFSEIKKEWGINCFQKREQLDDKKIKEKIYGGWLGRCAGCLLGKPVEGWSKEEIVNYLKDTGQYPLRYYIKSNFNDNVLKKYKPLRNFFIENITNMIEDDDINYTVLALTLIEKYNYDFTSSNFSQNLLEKIPILRTCTAERVVYKNLVNLLSPKISAFYRNPYREWIGAQIRADLYGYITPGNPEKGVELAYKDASVTHVKNGIYGAMYITAMISTAFFEKDIEKIIEYGINYVPQKSRLAYEIREIINYKKNGLSYEEISNIIHKKWNEKNPHHWCHVISNAQIVTIGLLWGNGNFEESVCKAVEIGFDTDCNGATVGSILGVMLGAENLPKKWIEPLNDTLETGVVGYSKVRISELAEKTFNLYKRGR